MREEITDEQIKKLEDYLISVRLDGDEREEALNIIEVLGLQNRDLTKRRERIEYLQEKERLQRELSNLEFKYRHLEQEECPF